MSYRNVLIASLLLFTIALRSFADYSILETPYVIEVNNAVCSGDYIWYTFSYESDRFFQSEDTPIRVGKLHIPTQYNQIFEVGYGEYENTQIVAVDSSRIAVYPKDYRHYKNVYYYNGSKWKTFTNVFPFLKKVLSLPSGKVMLLSVDSLGFIESDTIKKLSRLDLGVDQYLVDMGADSDGTAWIISKNHIVSLRGSVWKTEFICDSMTVLKEVRTNIDGSVRFITDKGHYTLFNGMLDELPESGETYSDKCTKDKSNRIWKINTNEITKYDFTDSLQMSHQGKLINFGNAENNGWDYWPVLQNYKHHSVTTSNNHVIIAYENGFYHYAGDETKKWEWIPLIEISKSGRKIDKIIISPDSTVYLSNTYNRIFKYNSGKYSSLPHVNYSSSIFVDRRNTLWLLAGKLFKWKNHFFCPVYFEGISEFADITEDNSGNIILLSKSGDILRKNGINVEIISERSSNIPRFAYAKILQTKDGKYWLRTSIDSIFQSSDLFEWEYVDFSKIPPNGVREIFATSKGNLIVVENFGGPIFKYDGDKWISLGVPYDYHQGDSYFQTVICEGNNGSIWYGSSRGRNGMLSIHKDKEWRILEADLRVNDIKCGPNNQVWVATNKGLRVYNAQTTEIAGKYFSQRGYSPIRVKKHSGQGKATVEYTIDKPGLINLSLYTSQGKKVETLKNGFHGKGSYRLDWKHSMAKGNYILLLSGPGIAHTISYANY